MRHIYCSNTSLPGTKRGVTGSRSLVTARETNGLLRHREEGALLGRIEIPRVRVSSIILEGTDDHTLALSVGHIPGTALPGREGNMALAGHRDTFFRGLQDIRKRDDIMLTTSGGTQHVYEVESMRVVAPEDVYVLDDIGRPILTLVTCYPFHYIGAAPKRFIVQAHRVGS